MKKNRHIFGPIVSRRLGLSLGIDLLPYKTCTMDCLYCECGATNHLTLERKDFVPLAEILHDLDQALAAHPALDYITFAGSGEPLLYRSFGELVAAIKQRVPQVKIALLTNGQLLADSSLHHELLALDLIVPSIDAISESSYQKINRPHHGIPLAQTLSGLLEFRQIFQGQIWAEVFILEGINDSDAEIRQLGDYLKQLAPHRVQLNTLDRPGTDRTLVPATWTRLHAIEQTLHHEIGGSINVEIISKVAMAPQTPRGPAITMDLIQQVEEILGRRPSTREDLITGLGRTAGEIELILDQLRQEGRIHTRSGERGEFFTLQK